MPLNRRLRMGLELGMELGWWLNPSCPSQTAVPFGWATPMFNL